MTGKLTLNIQAHTGASGQQGREKKVYSETQIKSLKDWMKQQEKW